MYTNALNTAKIQENAIKGEITAMLQEYMYVYSDIFKLYESIGDGGKVYVGEHLGHEYYKSATKLHKIQYKVYQNNKKIDGSMEKVCNFHQRPKDVMVSILIHLYSELNNVNVEDVIHDDRLEKDTILFNIMSVRDDDIVRPEMINNLGKLDTIFQNHPKLLGTEAGRNVAKAIVNQFKLFLKQVARVSTISIRPTDKRNLTQAHILTTILLLGWSHRIYNLIIRYVEHLDENPIVTEKKNKKDDRKKKIKEIVEESVELTLPATIGENTTDNENKFEEEQ